MPHEQDGSQPTAGSTTADGQPAPLPPYLERLAQHVSTHVDLDLLLQLAATISPAGDMPLQQHTQQQQQVACQQLQGGCNGVGALAKAPIQPCRCRIAVARDEAFCFYYQVCVQMM
jgi:cobyrinic acid a,c-diamide synthase